MGKDVTVSARLNSEQHDFIKQDAEDQGITMSKWLQDATDCYFRQIMSDKHNKTNNDTAIDEEVKNKMHEIRIARTATKELDKEAKKLVKEKVKTITGKAKELLAGNPSNPGDGEEPETNHVEKKTDAQVYKNWWE